MLPLVKLGAACYINPRLPKNTDQTQDVSFLSMSSISAKGKITGQETRALSVTKKGFTYFERGDILLAKITPCFENGKAVLTSELENPVGYGSTEFHVLRPVKGKSVGKYLFYLVWNDDFRFQGQHAMIGAAGQKRISANFLNDYLIPLPPLTEQQKIAAILDAADSLRQKDQQLIDHYTTLSQSLFLEMFGDPLTNQKDWPSKDLSDLSTSQLGKMLSKKAKQNISPRKYLRNANVRWRCFDLSDVYEMDFNKLEIKKFDLNQGDLLVCEGGEVGRCAIWRNNLKDCYFQKALHRVRVNNDFLTPEYLQEYFFWMARLGGLNASISEVTFSHLTAEKLKKLKVPLPPIGLQNQFAERIQAIEAQKQQAQACLEKSNDLFNSLLQKAFKAELNG